MAEPVTTAATGVAVSVGIMALLIGWVGEVGADVMMVTLASISGTLVALSGITNPCWKSWAAMLFVGILLSLVLAWSLAGLVTSYVPALSGDYLPSIIALLISFGSNRIPKILNAALDKAEEKAGLSK
jgi:hypothetical protein